MLEEINELREESGLRPFERHPRLDEAARAHSADMAWHDELVHVSPRTGDPAARVRAAGVITETLGENVAQHHDTGGALESLLASPPHRQNLLSNEFTHIGLASVTTREGQVYVTQVFARLEPQEPEPPAATPPPTPPAPWSNGVGVQLGVGGIRGGVRVAPNPPATPPPAARPATPAQPPSVAPNSQGLQVRVLTPGAQQRAHLAPDGRVLGYWVGAQGRWWYYRVPPQAAPGQLLQPVPVSGPGVLPNQRPVTTVRPIVRHPVRRPPPVYRVVPYRPQVRVQGQRVYPPAPPPPLRPL